MKIYNRNHACLYCWEVISMSSDKINEAYQNNKTPLYICSGCIAEKKHKDITPNEQVVTGYYRDKYG